VTFCKQRNKGPEGGQIPQIGSQIRLIHIIWTYAVY